MERKEPGFLDWLNSPFFIPAAIVNLAAGHVSIRYNAKGPNEATCTACTSSAHAVGDAFKIIARCDADVMIAGGTEAAITPMGVGGFAAMRALSTRNDAPEKASRPWDSGRDGFVIGEGAGILILEDLEFARRRGANILAEIVGYGMSGDAHHITQPSVEGPARAMQAALEDGGIPSEEVGYINAHGTGTLVNDVTEAAAIHQVFGPRASQIPVSSTKSLHGHSIGASGAIEALATIIALKENLLPANACVTTIDPAIDLDVILGSPRKATPKLALSNSLAFGGLNAVLALRPRKERHLRAVGREGLGNANSSGKTRLSGITSLGCYAHVLLLSPLQSSTSRNVR